MIIIMIMRMMGTATITIITTMITSMATAITSMTMTMSINPRRFPARSIMALAALAFMCRA
jgi:hypothetical protein